MSSIHYSRDQTNSFFYWSDKHKIHLNEALRELKEESWSWELPVFLLNRCWLRLEKIKLHQVSIRLPIDNSAEAPELKKYGQLLENGQDALLALQECWNEFGMEEFYRALRISWHWQAFGNNSWTFEQYILFIDQYKNKIAKGGLEIPLIVLGRQNTQEKHILRWINCESLSRELL